MTAETHGSEVAIASQTVDAQGEASLHRPDKNFVWPTKWTLPSPDGGPRTIEFYLQIPPAPENQYQGGPTVRIFLDESSSTGVRTEWLATQRAGFRTSSLLTLNFFENGSNVPLLISKQVYNTADCGNFRPIKYLEEATVYDPATDPAPQLFERVSSCTAHFDPYFGWDCND